VIRVEQKKFDAKGKHPVLHPVKPLNPTWHTNPNASYIQQTDTASWRVILRDEEGGVIWSGCGRIHVSRNARGGGGYSRRIQNIRSVADYPLIVEN
jgi:hypothetical protein